MTLAILEGITFLIIALSTAAYSGKPVEVCLVFMLLALLRIISSLRKLKGDRL